MKSVVCNVFGMAAAVACLALILNRPAGAEDKEKQEVQEATTTTVIQTDQTDSDVAQALQKALRDKMAELPEEIREKIKQKLQAVKELKELKVEAHPVQNIISAKQLEQKPGDQVKTIVVTVDGDGKQNVQEVTGKIEAKAYVVASDGDAKTVKVIGVDGKPGEKQRQAIRIVAAKKAEAEAKVEQAREKMAKARKLVEAKLKKAAEAHKKASEEQEVTVTAEACPEGAEKKICIAIAVDGDEISAKGERSITVKLEDGKLILNGKPIELPILKKTGEGEIKLEVKKADGDKVKKAVRRKMIFMGEDGKAQEFSFDVNVDVDHADKTSKATAYTVVVAKEGDGKGDKKSKAEAQSFTFKLDDAAMKGRQHVLMLGPMAGKLPLPHAIHVDAAQAEKTHAEVVKRLKGIESELKKIRKLLEQMQKEDAEEDDD